MKECKTPFATLKTVRVIAIAIILVVAFMTSAVSAAAYEVRGNTLAEVLGMDGAVYYQWLKSHEKDTYYNTTPYAHADHRNPNGDCDGANGELDTPGVPALNCMGFVWHMLYMPTKMSGGDTDLIPAYGKGGWYGLYTGYNMTRRYFYSKKDLLNSGYAEAGDIIWMFVTNEHVSNDSNHIAIYMGDGHSDRVWHAVKAGCKFGSINPDYEEYIVIKSGVIPKLATPQLKSVVNTVNGPKLTWKKVNNAKWYRVFVKNGTKWKVLCNTKNNYIIDKTAKSAQKTTYTVRCVDAKGRFMSDYNERGISNVYYETPGGFNAVSNETGILFSWKPVTGAAKYRVYRRTAGNDWEVVARTTATSFLDTKVQKANPYLYTVRVLDKNGNTVSDFRTPLKAYIISDIPRISDATVSNAGLTLTWNKIKGAEQYVITKKSGASWKKIGTSATNSFTYKTPDKNVATTYTVRCVSSTGNAYTSGYDRTGYTVMFQSTPKMGAPEAQINGIKVKWDAQQNAELYRVYRKEGAGSWVKLADTVENAYIDDTAEIGKSYTYTVRCATADGSKLVSGFDTTGRTMIRTATPVVAAAATDEGINVTWTAQENAAAYKVFIKRDGSWRTLANTTETAYLFTDVEHDTEYTFTVRCVDKNKQLNSFYSAIGAGAVYIDPNVPENDLGLAGVGAQPEIGSITEVPEATIPSEAATESLTESATEE